jgi:hypothetical protein
MHIRGEHLAGGEGAARKGGRLGGHRWSKGTDLEGAGSPVADSEGAGSPVVGGRW